MNAGGLGSVLTGRLQIRQITQLGTDSRRDCSLQSLHLAGMVPVALAVAVTVVTEPTDAVRRT